MTTDNYKWVHDPKYYMKPGYQGLTLLEAAKATCLSLPFEECEGIFEKHGHPYTEDAFLELRTSDCRYGGTYQNRQKINAI